ncbi:tyrosine-type recombinase/integrase [Nitrosovibrio sp. Nv4]|uniref:tyrosine-type recombinase/integrase n=1 Tax=Nitrosovibrio sp. Nv4 TaxID=1945880 RepID=UPI000BE3A6A3
MAGVRAESWSEHRDCTITRESPVVARVTTNRDQSPHDLSVFQARTGRDDLRFHDLRHAYGSWLVQNGVDLYLTGKLLRHKSLASTKRYAHFADEQKQNAVKKVFG